MSSRETRIGRIGERIFGASYMRDINRKAKRYRDAVEGRKPERQRRLPGF